MDSSCIDTLCNRVRLLTLHTSMHPACNRISSIYFRIIYFTFVAVRQPVLQARFPMTCIAGTTLYFLFSTLYCFYTQDKVVVKLRCLLDNIIIFLYKYMDLTSKFLIKIHTRKDPLKLLIEPPKLSIYPYTSRGWCHTSHPRMKIKAKKGFPTTQRRII